MFRHRRPPPFADFITGANLAPDGLYVIGQSHQRDTGIIGYGPFHYEAERDGCRVTLDWATDVRTDTLTQTADVEIVIRVEENGERSVLRHRTVESFATPLFLVAIGRLSPAPWRRSPGTAPTGSTGPTTTRPPPPIA